MKVLQIDDSPQICEMFADMFTVEGNTIKSVNDGKAGLELVVKNDYDLILLDIRMPEYSGVDFLKDLKEKRPSELKKIVVTSLLEFSETQANELMKFGIHSVEKKPSSFQQIETLHKKVNKKERIGTPRMLIINDQPETTTMFSKFFSSHGFQTTVTKDPWEGFLHIQKEQFDIILLDMYLPEFSGIQIIKLLATDEILQDQNIFMLPAPFGHNKEVMDLLNREGINGCLEKSMDLDEILRTVTKDLNFQKTIHSEII